MAGQAADITQRRFHNGHQNFIVKTAGVIRLHQKAVSQVQLPRNVVRQSNLRVLALAAFDRCTTCYTPKHLLESLAHTVVIESSHKSIALNFNDFALQSA